MLDNKPVADPTHAFRIVFLHMKRHEAPRTLIGIPIAKRTDRERTDSPLRFALAHARYKENLFAVIAPLLHIFRSARVFHMVLE